MLNKRARMKLQEDSPCSTESCRAAVDHVALEPLDVDLHDCRDELGREQIVEGCDSDVATVNRRVPAEAGSGVSGAAGQLSSDLATPASAPPATATISTFENPLRATLS